MSTRERLGIGMNEHVSFQFEFRTQLFIANLASHCFCVHFMCKFIVFFQGFKCRVGLFTTVYCTFEFQISFMHSDVMFEIIFIIELLATSWAIMLIPAASLIVNVLEMSHKIISQ